MPIKIFVAKTPGEIDEVFKIRHKVFCEEEGKFNPSPDGRIFDRFDTYPVTSNLIVTCDDQVVGSMRMTLDSPMGVPADSSFDFRTHLPAEYRLMSCGMYCVSKPFRSSRIALGLVLMASYFAAANNITHVVGPINPAIAKLVARIGFKALAQEIIDPHSGLKIIPIMLDICDTNDFFMRFAKKNQLQNFLGTYECAFYQPGECIVRSGERGDCAFVIVEGQADVMLPGKPQPIAILGEGDVFGELALLTDEIRSADVVAKTDLRVMTLSKSVFMESFLRNPERSVQFMQHIGLRMKKMLDLMMQSTHPPGIPDNGLPGME